MAAPKTRQTLRSEAQDTATPPWRLRELARCGLAREAAANPNTPTDLLLKLAGRHFDAFVSNPVLPLLLLEDPGFCLKIPVPTLRRLLRREQLPETFLRSLERHSDAEIRAGARLHVALPHTAEADLEMAAHLRSLPVRRGMIEPLLALGAMPVWLIEPLGGAADSKLRHLVLRTLKQNPEPEAQALWRLLERAGLRPKAPNTWTGPAPDLMASELDRIASGGCAARLQAARHPRTPPAVVQRLASDESRRVRLAALGNPTLPEQVLWACAGFRDERIREKIASNPAAPEGLLDQLAADPSAKVRRRVARHCRTADSTLARLALDPDRTIVLATLRHVRCGVATLEALSQSTDAWVRIAVAGNRRTPLAVCERLALDSSAGVRGELGKHGNVTREMYIALLCDRDDQVSQSARFRRGLPRSLCRKIYMLPKSPDEFAGMLKDWNPRPARIPAPIPAAIPATVPKRRYWRERLSHEEWQRAHKAMDQNISCEELDELAADPVNKVRENVAWNARTPVDLLRRLALDPAPSVRRQLAFNNTCTPDILNILADDEDNEVRRRACWRKEMPPDALARLAANADIEMHRRVAANPGTPPGILRKWASSTDAEIRTKVAGNPGTPPESLRALAAEKRSEIRISLARNPAVPSDLLQSLAGDSSAEVRAGLACNIQLPPLIAAQLARDPDHAVREEIAAHAALEPAIAAGLLHDAAPAVRRKAASRNDLGEVSYRALATDATPGMPEVLAGNIAVPADMLAALATNGSREVRLAIVYNSATPVECLLRLADDQEARIHLSSRKDKPRELMDVLAKFSGVEPGPIHGLLQDPNTPLELYERIVREGKKESLQALVHSDTTPVSILEMLVRHEDKQVSGSLAWRRNIPSSILLILLREAEPWTRSTIMERHKVPPEILAEVLADETVPDYVRRRMRMIVLGRPDTPLEILEQLARSEIARTNQEPARWRRRRFHSLGGDSAVLAALIRHSRLDVRLFEPVVERQDAVIQLALVSRADLPDDWRLRILDCALECAVTGPSLIARLAALAHPRTQPAHLSRFAESGRWIERYAVTKNPAASPEILAELARDANAVIRAAAHARLAPSSA